MHEIFTYCNFPELAGLACQKLRCEKLTQFFNSEYHC